MTDARRAAIAAMTPEQLDAAIDAVLRPGVAGTWPKHEWTSGNVVWNFCIHCHCHARMQCVCHVPPLPWASAEPGSEQADVCAGMMERWLFARVRYVCITLAPELHPVGPVAIEIGWHDGTATRDVWATKQIALARAVLCAAEDRYVTD